jgi:putative SOS response-associated peptidase YedK
MCGRFSQFYTWQELQALYAIHDAPPSNLEPRYNISPTDRAGIVRINRAGDLVYNEMRWGLVPFFWKKGLKQVPATFNARAESIASNGMFRDALKRHRCVVPASGFYEWTGPKTAREPWFVSAADGKPLSFAGLWDRWIDPATKEEIRSFTIVVTDASKFMAKMHDRMPVILDEAARNAWLAGPDTALLKPAPEASLRAWRVTPKMNSNKYQEADSVTAIDEP